MLFNSIIFAIFLPIVFLLYWVIGYASISESRKLITQNAFVIVASYIFYGWWDWRFLILIAFTSFCSWGSGLLIERALTQLKAKWWMISNIVLNIGILAIFKYYNFFVQEFCELFHLSTDGLLIKIILPVGISFYTFQALSYSIDIYRKKLKATNDIIAFFAFISFFPQLVAGPIERATNLLPQFQRNRTFDSSQALDGARQILWGLFKKMVIADNCATYVDQVWCTYSTQSGSTLLIAAILFTFQIYGDFSGYSDIAIGTAKLFGIRLMRNFNNPYFSRDIAEFWRRWHISLTTWFRDYVYIPLGGSRTGKWKIVRNTFVIFLVSGIWHGANWTFLAWGGYHALLFLPLILLGKNRKYTNQVGEGRLLPTGREVLQMCVTFALVVLGWIIFRAPNMATMLLYLQGICDASILSVPWIISRYYSIPLVIALSVMIIVEWFGRDNEHALSGVQRIIPNSFARTILYVLALFIVFVFRGGAVDFIYFQF